MKSKKGYLTIHDIRLAKERHRYETIMYREKLRNQSNLIFSNLSLSLQDLGINVRNRLFNYSFFRSLFKTGMLFSIAKSFYRGYRRAH